MRKLVSIAIILSFFTFLSGCLTTFFPIFTGPDIEFRTALLGQWRYKTKSESGIAEFERISNDRKKELPDSIRKYSDKGYLVSWKNLHGDLKYEYLVFLAKIGGHYFLDFYPTEEPWQLSLNSKYRAQFIRLHSCFRMDFISNSHFSIKQFEESYFDELIKTNQIRLSHEDRELPNNGRVITAPSKQLQQYLLKYFDVSKAYNQDNSFDCIRIQ